MDYAIAPEATLLYENLTRRQAHRLRRRVAGTLCGTRQETRGGERFYDLEGRLVGETLVRASEQYVPPGQERKPSTRYAVQTLLYGPDARQRKELLARTMARVCERTPPAGVQLYLF